MGKREKLLKRLLSRPKDFTYEEAVTLLHGFGYVEDNKGKTSGSRVMFVRGEKRLTLHKPHPGHILKPYQLLDIIDSIEK